MKAGEAGTHSLAPRPAGGLASRRSRWRRACSGRAPRPWPAARCETNKPPKIHASENSPIKFQVNKLPSPAQIRIDRAPISPPTSRASPIGNRETKSLTTGSIRIRRLPAEDGGEGAEVELLWVGALGAVHVHDVHGRLLRRRGWRVLLRLGRHGCCYCCRCCEEEEDQERATRLEERGTCLLHRRRLRGGACLYSRDAVVANLTMGSCSVCPYSGQLRRVTASRLLFPSRRSFFPCCV